MRDIQPRSMVSDELLESVKAYLDRHYHEPESQRPAATIFGSLCEDISAEPSKRSCSVKASVPVYAEESDVCPKKERVFALRKPNIPDPKEVGSVPDSLAERLKQTEETFTQAVLRIIQKNNWTEPEVYNRIYMDRKLFNKIRNKPDYQPKKSTAILLALALRLNLDETLDLIGKAGFTLTHSSRSDVIVEYFIQAGNYDVLELNEVLDTFGQPVLLKAE